MKVATPGTVADTQVVLAAGMVASVGTEPRAHRWAG